MNLVAPILSMGKTWSPLSLRERCLNSSLLEIVLHENNNTIFPKCFSAILKNLVTDFHNQPIQENECQHDFLQIRPTISVFQFIYELSTKPFKFVRHGKDRIHEEKVGFAKSVSLDIGFFPRIWPSSLSAVSMNFYPNVKIIQRFVRAHGILVLQLVQNRWIGSCFLRCTVFDIVEIIIGILAFFRRRCSNPCTKRAGYDSVPPFLVACFIFYHIQIVLLLILVLKKRHPFQIRYLVLLLTLNKFSKTGNWISPPTTIFKILNKDADGRRPVIVPQKATAEKYGRDHEKAPETPVTEIFSSPPLDRECERIKSLCPQSMCPKNVFFGCRTDKDLMLLTRSDCRLRCQWDGVRSTVPYTVVHFSS